MKLAMTQFSIKHPWLTIGLILLVTAGLGLQMPKVHFDNDPENMLSPDEPVRLFHHKVKEQYDLYDFIVVGVVNETHPQGIFNTGTLGRVHELTNQLLSLHRNDAGLPTVTTTQPDGATSERVIDMRPDSSFKKILNTAFHHDPNNLFDENGESALIAREIIAPSVVDNIKQADLGSLKLEYLMEEPPKTEAEARVIRDDAMNNPLYAGTLVSEDEKAVCLYLPIKAKHYSHNLSTLVQQLTHDWPAEDQVYITGLPVAEDTFGVEMLIQMATSAPMAGLAIFILMFLFFRRITLIIAPMVVAVLAIVMTMGLLIGLGYDVHIMSSMIAIFLMPIAVADAIHILSEFFDTYPRFKDKKETIRYVVGHLFLPMLYTSLTTIAGFASLATTPIPPVQVFGLHVAFGVAVAWTLTMTLVPAYIMIFVPEKSLENLKISHEEGEHHSALAKFLSSLGSFSFRHAKAIVLVTVLILTISGYGISLITVNDNPVNWFTKDHPIRVADAVLNKHFGGTYTAYINLEGHQEPGLDSKAMEKALDADYAQRFPQATQTMKATIAETANLDLSQRLDRLSQTAANLDAEVLGEWQTLADEVAYLDPTDLDYAALSASVNGLSLSTTTKQAFSMAVSEFSALQGDALLDKATELADSFLLKSFTRFIDHWKAEAMAPVFKTPEMLHYLQKLTDYLDADEKVGKTSSAVTALTKANYELAYVDPSREDDPQSKALIEQKNQANFAIPESAAAVGQVFTQLEGMKKKDTIFHLVTRDYNSANVWVQLTSGDNKDMERVVKRLDQFVAENPPPHQLDIGWAGLTYINVVWQDKMVKGMSNSLISSFVVVLIMMVILFRSVIFGLLAMIPLTATITFTYGMVGLAGKEYDMPIAVLSALTLGLSVDFAIHFLQRSRELREKCGSWTKAIKEMFKEPATAISRNAITIAIGFTPLLFAPLVPYKTVGFILASVMVISWMATLFILAALVTLLRKTLFKAKEKEASND